MEITVNAVGKQWSTAGNVHINAKCVESRNQGGTSQGQNDHFINVISTRRGKMQLYFLSVCAFIWDYYWEFNYVFCQLIMCTVLTNTDNTQVSGRRFDCVVSSFFVIKSINCYDEIKHVIISEVRIKTW